MLVLVSCSGCVGCCQVSRLWHRCRSWSFPSACKSISVCRQLAQYLTDNAYLETILGCDAALRLLLEGGVDDFVLGEWERVGSHVQSWDLVICCHQLPFRIIKVYLCVLWTYSDGLMIDRSVVEPVGLGQQVWLCTVLLYDTIALHLRVSRDLCHAFILPNMFIFWAQCHDVTNHLWLWGHVTCALVALGIIDGHIDLFWFVCWVTVVEQKLVQMVVWFCLCCNILFYSTVTPGSHFVCRQAFNLVLAGLHGGWIYGVKYMVCICSLSGRHIAGTLSEYLEDPLPLAHHLREWTALWRHLAQLWVFITCIYGVFLLRSKNLSF